MSNKRAPISKTPASAAQEKDPTVKPTLKPTQEGSKEEPKKIVKYEVSLEGVQELVDALNAVISNKYQKQALFQAVNANLKPVMG